jgi:hypothetical protein
LGLNDGTGFQPSALLRNLPGALPQAGMTPGLCPFIPVPPLAEQRRIVAEVDQLMALVDQLETQLAASRATAEELMEALVTELTATSAKGALQTSLGHRPRCRNRKQDEG